MAGCEQWLFIPKGLARAAEQRKRDSQPQHHHHGDIYITDLDQDEPEAEDDSHTFLMRNVSTIPGAYGSSGGGSGLAPFRKYVVRFTLSLPPSPLSLSLSLSLSLPLSFGE